MKHNVSLRKFPYPFKAALTLCNDLDEYTFDEFIEIHYFLNTKEETSLGQGLGLEIGDSFWMYSVNSDVSDAFSYFNGLSDKPSPYADAIKRLVKAGYLDCLHTYGNFNQYGGFHRDYTEKAIAELERQGMRVHTWVDHGDMHNFQNINYLGGIKERSIGNCDVTKVVEYHTDLSIKFGIHFYWPMIITPMIGQNRGIGWVELLSACKNRKWLIQNRLIYSILNYIPQSFLKKSKFFLKKKEQLKILFENPLIFVKTMDSGDKVYCFQRYGDWFQNDVASLGATLAPDKLTKLVKNNGISIVYVHMGRKSNDCADIIPEGSVKALRDLAARYNKGEIYVTTTTRLLVYNLVSQNLDWQVSCEKDSYVIDILQVKDEVYGDFVPTLEQLQGITFYTDRPEKTSVRIAGNKIVEIQINQPDENGRTSISIPRTYLMFPDIDGKSCDY